MFFKTYAPYLELGGLMMAVLEFLGFGEYLKMFFEWKSRQLVLLIAWFDKDTEIPSLYINMNNVSYFYLLFVLISSYVLVIKFILGKPATTYLGYFAMSLVAHVCLYFVVKKIIVPLVRTVIWLYRIILSVLVAKGVLSIIGLLIAVTSYVVNTYSSPQVVTTETENIIPTDAINSESANPSNNKKTVKK